MQDSLQGTMAEDTFIREVDEQMRQDRARELWSKYGKIIIALAVAIVLATAGTVAWRSYNDSVAAGFGDGYADAIALSNDGKHEEAIRHAQRVCELEPNVPFSFTALSVIFQRAYAGTGDQQFIQLAEDAMARSRMIQGV